LEAGCGQLTLAGDLALLGQREAGDGPTIAYELDSTHSYFIQDGERVYPLQLGVNSIGRLPDNSVVIRDECVSRRHCAIVIHRNGMCELHDVASKNGTVVNGKKIHGPTRLHPGDKISLCSRQIVFLVQNQNPNSPSPDS
jgi:pSer/pThr/pTyr-binding forkhead associated (FHA) protein